MGEYLNREHGFPCLGIRLTGHATHPEDMVRSQYTDWIASVEDGYHMLGGISKEIHLIGLSMGGVLSILMSTRLDVRSVVAMSTPHHLPADRRLNYTRLLSLICPYVPKGSGPPGSGWFDQEARKDHVSYPQNPVRSVGELNKLLAEMRLALPEVRVPVLLVHSRDDHYVPPENADANYAALGTTDKTMLWVTGSGHNIPREPPRLIVYQAAADFIHRVSQL